MKRILDGENDRIGRWICDHTGGVWSPADSKTIGLEDNGRVCAGVLYDSFNGASIRMHVASDGSRRWLNRQFLWFVFFYPFEQLKVKKVIGLVPSSNAPALKFDSHLGFVEEARITDAHPDGDIVVMTMNRQQCRWLKE